MMRQSGQPGCGGFPSAWVAEIKAALSLRETIERLAGARFDAGGGRLKACCPFHEERTPSFFVDDESGRYKCFGTGCGQSGDVIQFIADWHSMGFREAVLHARELSGLPMRTNGNAPVQAVFGWDKAIWAGIVSAAAPSVPRVRPSAQPAAIPHDVQLPLPGAAVIVRDDVNDKTFRVKPTHVHVYRKTAGSALCLVLRTDKQDGGKFFIQTKWETGHGGWTLARFGRGRTRPVYGLEDISEWLRNKGRRLLIVEGETTRDAAASLLPPSAGWLVLTAMGGANAVSLADWKPLVAELGRQKDIADLTIAVWPDADAVAEDRQGHRVDPQEVYFENVKSSILDAAMREPHLPDRLTFIRVKPPDTAPHGWDIADAASEGWTGERLLTQIGVSRAATEAEPEAKGNYSQW